jgi:hypothetical protein
MVSINGVPHDQKAEVSAPARSGRGGQEFGYYLLPSAAGAGGPAAQQKSVGAIPDAEGGPGQGGQETTDPRSHINKKKHRRSHEDQD